MAFWSKLFLGLFPFLTILFEEHLDGFVAPAIAVLSEKDLNSGRLRGR